MKPMRMFMFSIAAAAFSLPTGVTQAAGLAGVTRGAGATGHTTVHNTVNVYGPAIIHAGGGGERGSARVQYVSEPGPGQFWGCSDAEPPAVEPVAVSERAAARYGRPAAAPVGFAKAGSPQPPGLFTTAHRSAEHTHGVVSEALDPLVDPVLDATVIAAGTTAGVAVGVAAYPAGKVVERLY